MNSDLKSISPTVEKESKTHFLYPHEKPSVYPNKHVSTYPNSQKPSISGGYPPKAPVSSYPANLQGEKQPIEHNFLDLNNKVVQTPEARPAYNPKSAVSTSSYPEKPNVSTSSYPQRQAAAIAYPQNMKSATYPSDKTYSSYHEAKVTSTPTTYPGKGDPGSSFEKRENISYAANPPKSRQLTSAGKSLYPSKPSSSSSSSSLAVDYSTYPPQGHPVNKVSVDGMRVAESFSLRVDWWRFAAELTLLLGKGPT